MSKRILIIAANPTVSTTTGWPVGFWASEVTHPYQKFSEAGYEVILASPAGGRLEVDALSDPLDESRYSEWDEISKEVMSGEWYKKSVENSPSLSSLNPDNFDAILVAGGQAPMFSFETEAELQKFFSDFYQTGKVTAALCHGTAILNFAKDETGDLLVNGKTVTGFTNGEEDDADSAAGVKVMPWRIEDALTAAGAEFQKKDNWQPHVVADGNLITGQQNMSGGLVAEAIIDKLEKE